MSGIDLHLTTRDAATARAASACGNGPDGMEFVGNAYVLAWRCMR